MQKGPIRSKVCSSRVLLFAVRFFVFQLFALNSACLLPTSRGTHRKHMVIWVLPAADTVRCPSPRAFSGSRSSLWHSAYQDYAHRRVSTNFLTPCEVEDGAPRVIPILQGRLLTGIRVRDRGRSQTVVDSSRRTRTSIQRFATSRLSCPYYGS